MSSAFESIGIKGDPGEDSTVPGPKGDQGDPGEDSTVPGPKGDQGDPGMVIYKFSNDVTIADPGSGYFRFDSVDASDISKTCIDDLALDETEWKSIWLEPSTLTQSTTKAFIKFTKKSDLSKWLVLLLQSITDSGGYTQWSTEYLGGQSGGIGLPFLNNDEVIITLFLVGDKGEDSTVPGPKGDQGDPGIQGDQGDPGEDGADGTAAVTAHIADTIDAHLGTAIGNTPAGTISATTLQAAINELDTEKIAKTLYDANTIVKADSDDTPIALTMAASTILARLASGNIVAATPAELRTLLALVIGTNVQAWDADLDAIAALTSAADKIPYSTGAQAWSLATLTAFARTLLDDADAITARATLGIPVNKSLTAQPAIANTETVVLSYTCVANELAVGTTFRFKAFATKAGTQSAAAVIRIRVGTTTLTGNIAATLTPPANNLAVPIEIEGLVTVITDGSGGTIRGSLVQRVHLAAVTIGDAIAATAAVAVNTTTANMLIELTFISGHANNTYTFQNVILEKVVA